MKSSSWTERRAEPRIAVREPVHVEEVHAWNTDEAIGRAVDVSHSGMRLELDHPVDFGTGLRVDLPLGGSSVKLEGRVRSIREVDRKTHQVGVQFVGVSPEQDQALDAFLRD